MIPSIFPNLGVSFSFFSLSHFSLTAPVFCSYVLKLNYLQFSSFPYWRKGQFVPTIFFEISFPVAGMIQLIMNQLLRLLCINQQSQFILIRYAADGGSGSGAGSWALLPAAGKWLRAETAETIQRMDVPVLQLDFMLCSHGLLQGCSISMVLSWLAHKASHKLTRNHSSPDPVSFYKRLSASFLNSQIFWSIT